MGIGVRGLVPLLQVFHMPTAIRFYRDLQRFAITEISAAMSDDPDAVNWVMMRSNDAVVMLNTAYDPDDTPQQRDAARWAGHKDTALFIGCPDMDAAYEFLRNQGAAVMPPEVTHYGMKQIYLTDPDGFGICLQWQAKAEELAAVSAKAGVQVG